MPKTPNPDSPAVSVDDARELLNQQVRIRGNFAGGDYCYDGALVKVTDGDKPEIEVHATEQREQSHGHWLGGQYIPHKESVGPLKVFLPLRSVTFLIDAETAAQIDSAAQAGG